VTETPGSPGGRQSAAPGEALKDRLAGARRIEISVVGRKSGRTRSFPVWHVVEGSRLYLLPVRGSETQWYRNLLRNPAISIAARGLRAKLRAAPITRPAAVSSVIRKFGRKYKARIVRKLYSKFDVAVRLNLA